MRFKRFSILHLYNSINYAKCLEYYDNLLKIRNFVLTKAYINSHDSSFATLFTPLCERVNRTKVRNDENLQKVCGSYRHIGDLCK